MNPALIQWDLNTKENGQKWPNKPRKYTKNNLKISFFAAKDLLSPSINSGFPSGFLL